MGARDSSPTPRPGVVGTQSSDLTHANGSGDGASGGVTKKRGASPTPDAVRKVLYLAIERVSARWTRPIGNWTAALNHFAIAFEGRVEL